MQSKQKDYKDPVYEKIIVAVCQHFEVDESLLKNGTKFNIVYMRWICFYLGKKNTLLSMEDIAERMDKKKPAVYNGIENLEIRKKHYVRTVYDLQNIAEKAGISDF